MIFYLVVGSVIAFMSMVYCGVFDVGRYEGAPRILVELAADALPPDFSRWRAWGWPLVETLAMSIAGTILGAVIALVLAMLAAQTTAPLQFLSGLLRILFNLLRSLPELVLGIVLVATVGFGPLAGVIALALHSVGMLGKFFAETIEHADTGPIEALRSQGTSAAQTFCFGVLPQILPRLVDLVLYRWEHNLRASTVMGLVGAGGIGLELVSALKLFEYREALALLILILALVTAIDLFGAWLRQRFVAAQTL